MKKLTLLLIAGFLGGSVIAQDLPKPSPSCKTEQMVGLTTISLEYSRPSVKERKVFGDLVQYDQLWRLGANECTKITTTHDLMFGEQKLPAGTYALLATPSKSSWTLHINSDTELRGTTGYDKEKNVLEIKAPVKENSFNETFLAEVNSIRYNAGSLVFKWEKVRVQFDFTIDTKTIVDKNIQEAIDKGEDLDEVYRKAGAFYFSSVKDNDKAMEYAEKSIKVQKTFKNIFLKAEILYAQGKKDDAIKLGEEALAMAKEAEQEGWMGHISNTVEKWKK